MNPYTNLPENAFWKKAVSSKHIFDFTNLWEPRFSLTKKTKFVTYGSCFAQHIGRALSDNGFLWSSSEPPPSNFSESDMKEFGYNVFSSRTGNIYTTSLLKQWCDWAFDKKPASTEIWQHAGRFYDPFRPNIEPNGFSSEDELRDSRKCTIRSFRDSILSADVFVFTLGLTEGWLNKSSGVEYPMCPGTVAGEFDPSVHEFFNHSFQDSFVYLRDSVRLMREYNPNLKFLLTVSPVPLTATNSGQHVLVATMKSKSILRAVADAAVGKLKNIDYFPSYEIVNSPAVRGALFEPNMRNVHPGGVQIVMKHFFAPFKDAFSSEQRNEIKPKNKDEICEEALLEAFGEKN